MFIFLNVLNRLSLQHYKISFLPGKHYCYRICLFKISITTRLLFCYFFSGHVFSIVSFQYIFVLNINSFVIQVRCLLISDAHFFPRYVSYYCLSISSLIYFCVNKYCSVLLLFTSWFFHCVVYLYFSDCPQACKTFFYMIPLTLIYVVIVLQSVLQYCYIPSLIQCAFLLQKFYTYMLYVYQSSFIIIFYTFILFISNIRKELKNKKYAYLFFFTYTYEDSAACGWYFSCGFT